MSTVALGAIVEGEREREKGREVFLEGTSKGKVLCSSPACRVSPPSPAWERGVAAKRFSSESSASPMMESKEETEKRERGQDTERVKGVGASRERERDSGRGWSSTNGGMVLEREREWKEWERETSGAVDEEERKGK